MRMAVLAIAMVVAAGLVAAAVATKRTGFGECVAIVSADIERQALASAATLDPRDVEADAARTCAGAVE